jgi:hypothetical protein
MRLKSELYKKEQEEIIDKICNIYFVYLTTKKYIFIYYICNLIRYDMI